MLRTWCAFAGLCAVCLMRDNSFRLAPLDTSLMEGGKGKRNAEALIQGLLRPFGARAIAAQWGEPTSESTKDTPCGVCALSGATSSLRSSCRLRRGEPTSESTKDTPCGVCALSGATSLLRSSCRRKRRGEPTSENNISFSPALSFGCGSPPTKVQRKKRNAEALIQGLLRPFGARAIAAQWGEPRVLIPLKYQEKEECKCIPLFLGALSDPRFELGTP